MRRRSEEAAPYRRLAAAIIKRAVRDARRDDDTAAEARRWLLFSPLAAYLLDTLDVDAGRVRWWVRELSALAQPALDL